MLFGFKIIKSNNMSPSIKPGSLTIYYKNNDTYRKGDVVLVNINSDEKIYRILGACDDTIQIQEKGIFVNGIKEEINNKKVLKKTQNYKIEKNKFFVINDNSNDTSDSRSFGVIDIRNIKGIVIAKVQIRDF